MEDVHPNNTSEPYTGPMVLIHKERKKLPPIHGPCYQTQALIQIHACGSWSQYVMLDWKGEISKALLTQCEFGDTCLSSWYYCVTNDAVYHISVKFYDLPKIKFKCWCREWSSLAGN